MLKGPSNSLDPLIFIVKKVNMYQLCIVNSKSTKFESQFDEIETINLKVAYQRRKRWYAKRTIPNKNIHTKLRHKKENGNERIK